MSETPKAISYIRRQVSARWCRRLPERGKWYHPQPLVWLPGEQLPARDPDLLGLQLDFCHSDFHTLPSIKGLEQTKEPHEMLAIIEVVRLWESCFRRELLEKSQRVMCKLQRIRLWEKLDHVGSHFSMCI